MNDFTIEDVPKREQVGTADAQADDADLFALLLAGKAITKIINTSRGEFKVKFPLGNDRLKIDQLKAMRRGGVPANAFDFTAFYNNEIYSTLDVVVLDGPDWWREAKNGKQGWTWEDCPDEDLIADLYSQFDSFRQNIRDKIRQSSTGKIAGESQSSDTHAPVDDGAFSGIANRPASKKPSR
jgi:hypothetical protein